jgi:hypothetical protein
MDTVQATGLFSGDISKQQNSSIDLAVVCLWSFTGTVLTAFVLALGFGSEIWQALAFAG